MPSFPPPGYPRDGRRLSLYPKVLLLGLEDGALKAGIDEKTARKYLKTGEIPSELKGEHTGRTRDDPFEDVWEEVRQMLNIAPALEAVTIFEYLQDRYPDDFADGQLRTLQRKIKRWRATEGHSKEVMFAQELHPSRPG